MEALRADRTLEVEGLSGSSNVVPFWVCYGFGVGTVIIQKGTSLEGLGRGVQVLGLRGVRVWGLMVEGVRVQGV